MKPLSEHLKLLIAEAETAIRLPQHAAMQATPAFAALAAEIRRIDAQPAEGIRCTRAALIMLAALEGWFETGGEKGNPWLMLAGATLPLLRVDAWAQPAERAGAEQMSRIYVASSWRNPDQPGAVNQLRSRGHQVYDFRNPFNGVPGFAWSQIDPQWKAWSAARYRELLTTSPIAAAGFVNDLRGMQWADTCLLLLPCGRSAHLEAGWFCGQGKRCIVLTRDGEEPELMALLATDICISMAEVLEALG